MPQPIKYTTTNVSSSVRLGNIALGVNAVDYGPSSTTGWANGVGATYDGYAGGFVIYYLSGTNIRIRTADTFTLITVAGQIMNTTYASNAAALSGLAAAGYTVVNTVAPPNLVTSGSVFYLDAGLVMSYPQTNTTWYDISGNASSGTLTNGPTFDSTSNSIVFDGTDDAVIQYSPNLSSASGTKTVLCWCYPDSTGPSNDYIGLVSWGGRSNASPSNASLLSLKTTAATWYVGSAYWYNDYNPGILSVNKNAWNMVGMIARQQSTPNSNNTTLICGKGGGISYDTGNSSDVNRSISTTNANLSIGSTDIISRVFKGKIARVIIYNRELTTAEINQNYYQGNIVTSSLVMALDAGNLVSYPGSGTTWTTLTGSNSGTLTNGPTFSSANGGVIVLDGTNDYVDCGNGTSLQITGSITVETWAYFTSLTNTGDPDLISKYSNSGANNQGWILFKSTGDYRTYGPGGTGGPNNNEFAWLATSNGAFTGALIGTGEQVSLNTWYQVVGVFNSSNNSMQIYVNGNLKYSATRTGQTSGVLLNASRNVYIGGTPEDNNRYLQGKVPISRVYNKALTSTEVAQNFNAQRNRFNL